MVMQMLATPLQKIKQRWKSEKPASIHINILGHLDDKTLIDKEGQLIRLFSLKGFDPMLANNIQLESLKQARNSLWKNFTDEFAIYTWMVRTRRWESTTGTFQNTFAHLCDAQYQKSLSERTLLTNQLYLAIVTKSPEGALQKSISWLQRFQQKSDRQARTSFLNKTLTHLDQMTQHLLRALAEYDIELISQEQAQGSSKALTFLSELINTTPIHMPYRLGDLRYMLAQARLFFHSRSGMIEWRFADGTTKVGAMVTIKEYANFTTAGLLDALNAIPFECIVTQSFCFFDRTTSKAMLKHQRSDMEQTQDDAQRQSDELLEALDDTASGDIGYGRHHLSILCLSDHVEKLKEVIATVMSALGDQDILAVKEDLLSECAFWAQLPGNLSYSPRPAPISTQNFAGFAGFHQTKSGTLHGNHWGEAVTVLETRTGSPYYFNFHHRDVGNTLIFGGMGSGKTALMGFLLAQSVKFGGKRIVFDKDHGLEIAVRALGGVYDKLKPGHPSGFNPCQLPDTLDNRAFLATLFKKMLICHGQSWSEADAQQVAHVIEVLYTLPQQDRRFRDIAPLFGSKIPGSLRVRFDEWHSDGAQSWLFDNEHDQLNLEPDMIGIELGALLKEEAAKIPACMYLMHRINQALEGQRGALFVDEGWALVDDSFFENELENWGRTPRKKDRFLVLATHSPEDAVKSRVCDALITSSSNLICFPNPSASQDTYVTRLGLPTHLFEQVKNLNTSERFFLLYHGKGQEGAIVRADLSDCPDVLNVLSGRESSVLLLNQLREQYGEHPDQWLEMFLKRIKDMRR